MIWFKLPVLTSVLQALSYKHTIESRAELKWILTHLHTKGVFQCTIKEFSALVFVYFVINSKI